MKAKKEDEMKKVALIVVALVGILFVCLALGVIYPAQEKAEEAVVVEPTPTFEVAATLETLLATPTPRPTSTPEMSEGVGNIADLIEFVMYLDMIGPVTEIIGIEATGLADQFGKFADDPYVTFTDVWITKTAGHLATMELMAGALVETDAPVLPDWPLVQEIETAFKCSGREMILGVEDLIYGIDNILPDVLEEGIVHLDASTVCADRASALLNEFNEMTTE
ncbi:hypothetical protein ES705_35503 [subsurface metagenome]